MTVHLLGGQVIEGHSEVAAISRRGFPIKTGGPGTPETWVPLANLKYIVLGGALEPDPGESRPSARRSSASATATPSRPTWPGCRVRPRKASRSACGCPTPSSCHRPLLLAVPPRDPLRRPLGRRPHAVDGRAQAAAHRPHADPRRRGQGRPPGRLPGHPAGGALPRPPLADPRLRPLERRPGVVHPLGPPPHRQHARRRPADAHDVGADRADRPDPAPGRRLRPPRPPRSTTRPCPRSWSTAPTTSTSSATAC